MIIKCDFEGCANNLRQIADSHKVKHTTTASRSGRPIVELHCPDSKAKAIRKEWRDSLTLPMPSGEDYRFKSSYEGYGAKIIHPTIGEFILVAPSIEALKKSFELINPNGFNPKLAKHIKAIIPTK